jgi:hypothetical protein
VKYRLELVTVEESRWEKGGSEKADILFLRGKRSENHQLQTGFLVHKGTTREVRKVAS